MLGLAGAGNRQMQQVLLCLTLSSALQQENPAILYNGNNEYLHYEDTWYILDSKPDEYVVIFYIGNNDAWKGYGGATIYSRWARGITVSLTPAVHH